MELLKDIRSRLLATPDVTLLLGTSPLRFYPNALHPTAEGFDYPAASYQVISYQVTVTGEGRRRLTRMRLQIDSYGIGVEGYGDAHEVDQTIADVLEDLRGTIGNSKIQNIQTIDLEDRPDRELGTDDALPYRVRRDYEIWYEHA